MSLLSKKLLRAQFNKATWNVSTHTYTHSNVSHSKSRKNYHWELCNHSIFTKTLIVSNYYRIIWCSQFNNHALEWRVTCQGIPDELNSPKKAYSVTASDTNDNCIHSKWGIHLLEFWSSIQSSFVMLNSQHTHKPRHKLLSLEEHCWENWALHTRSLYINI